jgi:hypothetical protein
VLSAPSPVSASADGAAVAAAIPSITADFTATDSTATTPSDSPLKLVLFAGTQKAKVISTNLTIPQGGFVAPASASHAPPHAHGHVSGHAHAHATLPPVAPAPLPPTCLTEEAVNWKVYGAHYGFVYSLAIHKPPPAPALAGVAGGTASSSLAAVPQWQLLSGSGDAKIGVWNITPGTCELELVRRLEGHSGSVYALEVLGADLFSGGCAREPVHVPVTTCPWACSCSIVCRVGVSRARQPVAFSSSRPPSPAFFVIAHI